MAAKSGQRKNRGKAPARKAVSVQAPVEEVVVKPGPRREFGSTKVIEESLGSRGWVVRVWHRVTGRRDEGMKENLDAVKAGVMHELESLSAEKGIPLKGQPFSNVVLPQIRRRRPWVWPLVVGSALVLVVLMVMVGRKPADPARAMQQVMVSLEQRDVATFDSRVDVAAVASSVVNQLFSSSGEGQVSGSDVEARVTAFIKPGLADALKDEILQAVREGSVSAADDKNLLKRLWTDLGGEHVRVGPIRVAMQERDVAVAEVPLERADLGLTLPLQVVLNRGNDGRSAWQVADVPNFAAVLQTLSGASYKKEMREEGRAAAVVEGKVMVRDVRKAKALVDGLLLTMAVHNASDGDLQDVRLKVTFGDAAGQPLKVAELTVEGLLKAGETREQTWTVAVDRSKSVERYVLDLPLSALTVKVVPLGN